MEKNIKIAKKMLKINGKPNLNEKKKEIWLPNLEAASIFDKYIFFCTQKILKKNTPK